MRNPLVIALAAALAASSLRAQPSTSPTAKPSDDARRLASEWRELPAKVAALSKADTEALERATGSLAGRCPVCRHAPETFRFLHDSFAVQLAASRPAASADPAEGNAENDVPAELRTVLSRRDAANAAAVELTTAVCERLGGSREKTLAPQSLDEAARAIDVLAARACRLREVWTQEIPEAWRKLSKEDAKTLAEAMAVIGALHPGARLKAASIRTLGALARELCDQDAAAGKACPLNDDPEWFRKHPVQAHHARVCVARAGLAEETAKLLAAMETFLKHAEAAKPAAEGTSGGD